MIRQKSLGVIKEFPHHNPRITRNPSLRHIYPTNPTLKDIHPLPKKEAQCLREKKPQVKSK